MLKELNDYTKKLNAKEDAKALGLTYYVGHNGKGYTLMAKICGFDENGYWQFENEDEVFEDKTQHGLLDKVKYWYNLFDFNN